MNDPLKDSATTLTGFAARRLREPALFERALKGDPQAFAEVYRRYRTAVYAYCLARLGSRAAAEDAAQEVFLRLLSADAERIAHGRAWLYGVARNVCADHVRRRREIPAPAEAADGTVPETLRTADETGAVLDAESASHVVLALRRLLPRYRTALVMREIHGTSSAEIGGVMGLKPGAVDTLVSRARDALGLAYAEVADLPAGCRRATELIYRQTGTGISEGERTSLAAHMDECPRCAAESRRASDPRYLPALLPWLLTGLGGPRASSGGHAVIARLMPGLSAAAPGAAAPWTAVPDTVLRAGVAMTLAVGLVAAPLAGFEGARLSHALAMRAPEASRVGSMGSGNTDGLGMTALAARVSGRAGELAHHVSAGPRAAGVGRHSGNASGNVAHHAESASMGSGGGPHEATTGSAGWHGGDHASAGTHGSATASGSSGTHHSESGSAPGTASSSGASQHAGGASAGHDAGHDGSMGSGGMHD